METETTVITFAAVPDTEPESFTKRFNSFDVNGIKILKTTSNSARRFFIGEVNETTLEKRIPNNSIDVGDEVIQINNSYCEHIGNVSKYIETTHIKTIQLKKRSQPKRPIINGNLIIKSARP